MDTRHKSTGPTKRDMFGQSHGSAAGKGDALRTTDHKAFRANMDEIKWPKSSDGFKTEGGKQVKRYGAGPERLTINQMALKADETMPTILRKLFDA